MMDQEGHILLWYAFQSRALKHARNACLITSREWRRDFLAGR
jgi:hypothetical protein